MADRQRAPVRLEIRGGVARIALNRPGQRNALSAKMIELLGHHLARLASDPEVKLVSLSGVGTDFCAGADLEEIAASQSGPIEDALVAADALGDLLVQIRRAAVPVVAVVRGRAIGGGAGLAAACDIVLAHQDASFAFPEVRIGFVPAVVLAVLRRKVGEANAFEMAIRGQVLGAAEAARVGLATRVIEGGDFDGAIESYLGELATRPASAVSLTKRLFVGLDRVSFEDAIARGAEANAIARMTRSCRDGVRRFLDRR